MNLVPPVANFMDVTPSYSPPFYPNTYSYSSSSPPHSCYSTVTTVPTVPPTHQQHSHLEFPSYPYPNYSNYCNYYQNTSLPPSTITHTTTHTLHQRAVQPPHSYSQPASPNAEIVQRSCNEILEFIEEFRNEMKESFQDIQKSFQEVSESLKSRTKNIQNVFSTLRRDLQEKIEKEKVEEHTAEEPKRLVEGGDLQIIQEHQEKKEQAFEPHRDFLSISLCPKSPPTTQFPSTLPPPIPPLKPPDPPPKPPYLLMVHSVHSFPASPSKPPEPPPLHPPSPKPPDMVITQYLILAPPDLHMVYRKMFLGPTIRSSPLNPSPPSPPKPPPWELPFTNPTPLPPPIPPNLLIVQTPLPTQAPPLSSETPFTNPLSRPPPKPKYEDSLTEFLPPSSYSILQEHVFHRHTRNCFSPSDWNISSTDESWTSMESTISLIVISPLVVCHVSSLPYTTTTTRNVFLFLLRSGNSTHQLVISNPPHNDGDTPTSTPRVGTCNNWFLALFTKLQGKIQVTRNNWFPPNQLWAAKH
ncbi:unnamed protein product [Trifolium pratense]|uniref:Uncharacterized protein n=1 Tax=Trifolium pratense TaxID=57577 RepID=A0ACB0MCE1_TRIPR|nr:unnamed protein product [Trifolium pratense]